MVGVCGAFAQRRLPAYHGSWPPLQALCADWRYGFQNATLLHTFFQREDIDEIIETQQKYEKGGYMAMSKPIYLSVYEIEPEHVLMDENQCIFEYRKAQRSYFEPLTAIREQFPEREVGRGLRDPFESFIGAADFDDMPRYKPALQGLTLKSLIIDEVDYTEADEALGR